MLNRKIIAMLLAGVLALSLCATALAAEGDVSESGDPSSASSASQDASVPEAEAAPAHTGDAPEKTGETGTDVSEEPAATPDKPIFTPDPAGTIRFANLDGQVRAGNLNYLVLQESVARIEANDYEKMKEDLRNALNDIANAQWQLHTGGSQIPEIPGMPELSGALQGMISMSNASASQALKTQYDALREQFDDLKEGKIQQQAADGIRQLQEAQNSIVMLAQGMYVQLDALNATDQALGRSLDALDRQLEELELRYKLGQISALTLQQAKAGRTALVSSRQTLQSNAASLNMSLESMVGAALTGQTKLGTLPKVSGDQLAAMDLEADLAAAKEASFTLYDAKKTLDDAEEAYKDAGKEYSHNEKKYQYVQAQHAWQGAQYTYQGAVQSFELKFRTLYAQVKDYAQVLTAAQTALAVEQDDYSAAQLKYQQGSISKNALLTAQDDVSTAQDKVTSAQRDLFSAYNNYRWAVDHGILN